MPLNIIVENFLNANKQIIKEKKSKSKSYYCNLQIDHKRKSIHFNGPPLPPKQTTLILPNESNQLGKTTQHLAPANIQLQPTQTLHNRTEYRRFPFTNSILVRNNPPPRHVIEIRHLETRIRRKALPVLIRRRRRRKVSGDAHRPLLLGEVQRRRRRRLGL